MYSNSHDTCLILQTEDSSETKDTVKFTPKAVAEYLARTGEIDEFEERVTSEISCYVLVNFLLNIHSNV